MDMACHHGIVSSKWQTVAKNEAMAYTVVPLWLLEVFALNIFYLYYLSNNITSYKVERVHFSNLSFWSNSAIGVCKPGLLRSANNSALHPLTQIW